jgi:hypothetical protein
VVPTGYAQNISGKSKGVGLGTDDMIGHNAGIALYSGGGNVTLRGQNTVIGNSGYQMGVGLYKGVTVDAGLTGNIRFEGLATGGAYLRGVEFDNYSGAFTGVLLKTRNGNITLNGEALGASGDSIGVSIGGTMAATGTGGAQRRNAESLGSSLSGAIQSVVDRLGGTIGQFAVSIGQNGVKFRVDPTGQGRTSKKQSGVLAFDTDADAAFAAALEDAIRDGAVSGVSPRVQSALQRYAGDIDKAVAEALKVRDLENFLGDRSNPFASVFRDFERQAAERLKVARQYGFDVIEIEKVNAEERAKLLKQQLAETTASAKALLV